MKRAIVAGTLLALAGTGTAFAQQDNPSGFYAGAGIGQFNFSGEYIDNFDDVDDTLEDFDFDDDDNSWKVFAGYRFLPWLQAELAYVDFGRTEDRVDTSTDDGTGFLELSGLQPALIASLPLGPVELFGKVSYLFYDIDVEFDFSAPLADSNDAESGEAFGYGVGIGFTILDRVPLKFEYEEFDVDPDFDLDGEVDDASAYWLTAAWRF